MIYRKKPVTVEAIQYTGLNRTEIERFVGRELQQELESETAYVAGQGPPRFSLLLPTLEGVMRASQDDFIVRGVQGEFYPCKPSIFAQTYDRVEEQQ